MCIAGIQAIEPGFRRFEIYPRPVDLEKLELDYHTVQGKIKFKLNGKKGNRILELEIPENTEAELVLHEKESVKLPALSVQQNLKRYLSMEGA